MGHFHAIAHKTARELNVLVKPFRTLSRSCCNLVAQPVGVADSLEETIGLTPWTKTHPLVQMIRQQIRSQVDQQSWEGALAAGRALTLEQAIDLVCRLGEGLHS